MADFKLQCACGDVQGRISDIKPGRWTRTVCHCNSCQAYARHLRDDGSLLDEFGGSDIVQMTPAQVTIDKGMDRLRCLRLKKKGLYRWYADCCKTPVGNTVSSGFPFVGLFHYVLEVNGPLDNWLGPVGFYVQGKTAAAERPGVKTHDGFPIQWFLKSGPWILTGKIRGKQRPSPFFDDNGRPKVKPEILDPAS